MNNLTVLISNFEPECVTCYLNAAYTEIKIKSYFSEMDTIDTYWVPESFVQSQTVLRQYCPAGINESSVDYDISLNAASLIQVCGEYNLRTY